ncbi:MAG TPA: polysaccharide biosynthesis/export family protein [Vicinamibacteria bacterium]|nr:polysaccharide biosynthesis/export family protein [Vicinamibacteria bacterium]
MTFRLGSCTLGLLLLAAACVQPRGAGVPTTQSSDLPRTAEPPASSSTLGAGDLLEVRVFEEADLSGPYRVSPGGTIDFPLCGKVKVEGLNGSSAADLLTKCLGEKYLKRPQVSVLVREYNSKKIFVFGEVQKPGTFPYDEDMSIIQAITMAGGFTKVASKNDIAVTRQVEGRETKIRVPVADIGTGREKNFRLQPGDIVFVPESIF